MRTDTAQELRQWLSPSDGLWQLYQGVCSTTCSRPYFESRTAIPEMHLHGFPGQKETECHRFASMDNRGYCRRRALMLGMPNCRTLRLVRPLTSSDLSLWRRETMTSSQLAEVGIVSSGSGSFRAFQGRRRRFDKSSSIDGSS